MGAEATGNRFRRSAEKGKLQEDAPCEKVKKRSPESLNAYRMGSKMMNVHSGDPVKVNGLAKSFVKWARRLNPSASIQKDLDHVEELTSDQMPETPSEKHVHASHMNYLVGEIMDAMDLG